MIMEYIKSDLIGKTIVDLVEGRTGVVVDGHKVNNPDSPYSDVIKALYTNGDQAVHIEHKDGIGFNKDFQIKD